MIKGSCMCGDVRFETDAEPQGASACHCGQCRKMSGHVWSSAYVARGDLVIGGPVKWFTSSALAKRGFCGRCGSFMFWVVQGEDTISFALGAVDGPTGLRLSKHIFVAGKGDYYDICDGVVQR